MSDEAHLSAEPPRAQAAPRLPRALGDAGRPQGAGGAPCARPQDALGLRPAARGLRRRAEFLAANAGKRLATPGFVLLVRARGDGDAAMGIGITVTRKIGGAVERNRMKRRFRALAREILPTHGVAGADHVLIGRAGGVEREYATLGDELRRALTRIARP
jgi:ribonuclease P protein component